MNDDMNHEDSEETFCRNWKRGCNGVTDGLKDGRLSLCDDCASAETARRRVLTQPPAFRHPVSAMNDIPFALGHVEVLHPAAFASGPRITRTYFYSVKGAVVAVDFWTNEAGRTVRVDAPRAPRPGEWNGAAK